MNNYGFEIQRTSPHSPPYKGGGAEGKGGWETLAFIPGYGNSNSPKSYSFTDNHNLTLNPATADRHNLLYRLKQINFDGSFEYSNTVEISLMKSIADEFELYQNYPNPFNPTTVISYTIPTPTRLSPSQGEGVREGMFVSLKIYDMLGNEIKILVSEYKPAGNYKIEFDGSNLSSGLYFYMLGTNEFSQTKSMLLLK